MIYIMNSFAGKSSGFINLYWSFDEDAVFAKIIWTRVPFNMEIWKQMIQ